MYFQEAFCIVIRITNKLYSYLLTTNFLVILELPVVTL